MQKEIIKDLNQPFFFNCILYGNFSWSSNNVQYPFCLRYMVGNTASLCLCLLCLDNYFSID